VLGIVGEFMNSYLCFYNRRMIEVHASTSYEAQQKAAVMFGIKKGYKVTVLLAEKNGEQVIHDTAILG
jgi:hypothetical protein